MPVTPLPIHSHPAEPEQNLPYVDLDTLDLSDYDRPGGQDRLAEQLKASILKVGASKASSGQNPHDKTSRGGGGRAACKKPARRSVK
ncbi:hypothetical protein E4U42_001931 [Claviceps africana]|uniref:Uncharacterized protein n=1 Tax=Claviceps africana TaxID=83212 RepID=A0A8K0NHT5_9HYPO|nr:hypothetical protein E4U42_001931 [Claviceps africana]